MVNRVVGTFVWLLVFSEALYYFLSDNSIHNSNEVVANTKNLSLFLKMQMSAMLEKSKYTAVLVLMAINVLFFNRSL